MNFQSNVDVNALATQSRGHEQLSSNLLKTIDHPFLSLPLFLFIIPGFHAPVSLMYLLSF
jgi:hypothetical protein